MTEQPLISAIIPVYNAEKYISKCIESVQNNSYKNLEIIIVNDGSKDNTKQVIESFCNDERIVLINKENGGVSSARNAGIDNSTGEFITFIDADDYISEDYFETLLNAFDAETDIVCCRHLCVDKQGNDLTVKYFCPETSFSLTGQDIADNYFKYVTGIINACWGKLYRRSIIENTCFSHTLKWGEDASFNLELFKKMGKMKVLPHKIYSYVLYEGQTITQKNKGHGEMLIEYVGNINEFIKHYNGYEKTNIRMGRRCLLDFFVAATHADNLNEYKSVFLKLKNTEWYKYISEIRPKKTLYKIIYKAILTDNYFLIYIINKIYNFLVQIKRKLKK